MQNLVGITPQEKMEKIKGDLGHGRCTKLKRYFDRLKDYREGEADYALVNSFEWWEDQITRVIETEALEFKEKSTSKITAKDLRFMGMR